MAVDVVMPQMGESIFEGTITKWLKKPGDKVERDEPLFEISTDKVDAEIPSPSAGVLQEIKIPEGQTVPIQTVVAVIDGAGSAAAATPAPAAAPTKPPAPAAAPAAAKPAAPTPQVPPPPAAAPAPAPAPASAVSSAAPSATTSERIHSSPLVRRMAKEHNIDLTALEGTGAGGRITKEDMESAIAAQSGTVSAAASQADGFSAAASSAPVPAASRPAPPPPAPAPLAAAGAPAVHGSQYVPALQVAVPRDRLYFGDYEVQPMSMMRQKIAEHMVGSKHVSPHVYSVDEIDMSKVVSLRAKAKEEFEARYGTKLTYMPFFVKAVVNGLRAYPTLNASLDGTNVVLHKEINIGMAVALDWGLIVPVIKNADEKNILGIQRNMNDLAERAAFEKAQARRSSGGHLLYHQSRRLRRIVRLAGDQPAERRHFGAWRD